MINNAFMNKSLPSNSEQGMALVLVIVFTGLLLVIGSALITFAYNEKQISAYQAQDVRQYYLAEAGIEAALAILKDNFYYRESLHASLGEGSFAVKFEETSEKSLLLISTGSLEKGSITLQVKVEQIDGQNIMVTEWAKP